MNRMYRGKYIHAISENKHLDSKWVYGYLCDENYISAPGGGFLVDETTIGQYIGIDDKNSMGIYESDILKIHQFLFDGVEFEQEIVGCVEYRDDLACFSIKLFSANEINKYMGYNDPKQQISVPFCEIYGLHEESYEIIGNVFDNPELLEV